MTRILRNLIPLIIMSGLFLSGCAAPQRTRILYPEPPAKPYLEYIQTFYSQHQFPKSGFQSFMEGLVGEAPPAKFLRPFGVASNGKGKVYISDPLLKNIRIYDFNNKTVNFMSKQPMGSPYGLAVDSAGRLYVADTDSKSILVYDSNEKPLFSFGAGEIEKPVKLAINERLGRIYVTDPKAHQVGVFDMKGAHLFNFGQRGEEEGDLHAPTGVAVGKDNRVYVSEGLNARVQVFDADGNYLFKFGERGDHLTQFEFPKDLAFDSEGHLHIVDSRKGALLTYSAEGDMLLYTGTGGPTYRELGFGTPTSIWIDPDDRIYIVDLLNQRLAVWQYLSEEYLRKHPIEAAVGSAAQGGE